MSEEEARRVAAWDETLDSMARHVEEIRSGLLRKSPMPPGYTVATPGTPLPAALRERAVLVASAQRDVEIALRERVGILAAAMHREPLATRAAISLYIDRRA